MNTPDLSPILRQQNAVRDDFAAKSAANTFSRTLSQQRGNRQIADFRQGFQRQLPNWTSQWGRRGLAGGGIQSGVMRGAMQNYLNDYTRDLGRLTEDVYSQNRQFDFNEANYTAERDRALADLHAQKQALIAQTAQHLAALRPYMGGS